MTETELIPMWLLLAAGMAFLVPWGVALVAAGGLNREEARQVALTPLAAFALATVAYVLTGFAFHYGGIGLLVDHPDLEALVWEWSALSEAWGATWGMAGLAGFGMEGARTQIAYLLLLTTLPWATTATLLPLIVLRGRVPAVVTAFFGALVAFLGYPVVANWIQGGGWLANLGFNAGLGHGYVDFGGAFLFLLGGGVALAAILVFLPGRDESDDSGMSPPVHLPWLAVLGASLTIVGSGGWLLSWPLTNWTTIEAVRVVVHALLAAAAGGAVPLLYTWFVARQPDPLMGARGVAAGWVAGLAAGAFVSPTAALLIGALAGLLLVLTLFVMENRLRLQDPGGVFATFGLPALLGILALGIFADGTAGADYNGVGRVAYLGVLGQGVTGLLPAEGFVADWPGQMQAQFIGVVVIFLSAFLVTSILAAPLAFIARARGDDSDTMADGEADEIPSEADRGLARESGIGEQDADDLDLAVS